MTKSWSLPRKDSTQIGKTDKPEIEKCGQGPSQDLKHHSPVTCWHICLVLTGGGTWFTSWRIFFQMLILSEASCSDIFLYCQFTQHRIWREHLIQLSHFVGKRQYRVVVKATGWVLFYTIIWPSPGQVTFCTSCLSSVKGVYWWYWFLKLSGEFYK